MDYLEAMQVKRLIAAAFNIRDRLLVRIIWRTGIGANELLNILTGNIDYERRAIAIKSPNKDDSCNEMTSEGRFVPIDKGTLDMIVEYLEWRRQFNYKGDLLFPISRQRLSQIIERLGRKARLTVIGQSDLMTRSRICPSIIRNSFAVHCIRRGMSLEALQKILGHRSSKTTSLYLKYLFNETHDDYDRVWLDDESDTNDELTSQYEDH